MSIDVIRLAKEAHGALITEDYPGHTGQLDPWTLRLLERHTSLVMEECAKVAAYYGPSRPIISKNPSSKIVGRWEGEQAASYSIAAVIRARKP